jgi:hypothetical protein
VTLHAVLVASWPDQESLSLRLVLAWAIQFGFVAALAARLLWVCRPQGRP